MRDRSGVVYRAKKALLPSVFSWERPSGANAAVFRDIKPSYSLHTVAALMHEVS